MTELTQLATAIGCVVMILLVSLFITGIAVQAFKGIEFIMKKVMK